MKLGRRDFIKKKQNKTVNNDNIICTNIKFVCIYLLFNKKIKLWLNEAILFIENKKFCEQFQNYFILYFYYALIPMLHEI